MTFISSVRSVGDRTNPFTALRRASKVQGPRRIGDEDGARRAMGTDLLVPAIPSPGASLEHLARIALG